MIEAVGSAQVSSIIPLICCLPALLAITIILFAVSLKRLGRPDSRRPMSKAILKLAVIMLTVGIVIQLQIYYEVLDIQESMKPELTYYDTKAPTEIHQVYLNEGSVWDSDALFIGQRGVLAYVASDGGSLVLKTRTTTDGLNWSAPAPRLVVGSTEVIKPWGLTCVLRKNQSGVDCDYSYEITVAGVPRISWTITTFDMTVWSEPAPTKDPSQGESGNGFELPRKFSNFRDVDISDLSVLPTEAGGHLIAIGYERFDYDMMVFEGSFYALGTHNGDWTDLVRIPAGSGLYGLIKLHEVSSGNFLAVHMDKIEPDFYGLAYVHFPESALKVVRPPVLQVP